MSLVSLKPAYLGYNMCHIFNMIPLKTTGMQHQSANKEGKGVPMISLIERNTDSWASEYCLSAGKNCGIYICSHR